MQDGYVLIIGSSNIDLNIYSRQLPNPGETVTGGTFKQFLGGKGANQAVASVRSGAKTVFIAKIGKDGFGNQMIDRFTKEGIDTTHIIRDSQEASGVAFILIDENGENMISVAPGANARLSKTDIENISDVIKNASVIIVQMEIPIETIEVIYDIASQGSAIKILNPAPLKPIPPDVLKNIDIIIPNEGELFRLHSLLNFEELGTRITLRTSRPDLIRDGIQDITDILRDTYGLGIPQVEVEEVKVSNLDAQIIAERLAFSLDKGRHYERAGNYILRKVMDTGAYWAQVIIAGKQNSQGTRNRIFRASDTSKKEPPAQGTIDIGIVQCKKKPENIVIVLIERSYFSKEEAKTKIYEQKLETTSAGIQIETTKRCELIIKASRDIATLGVKTIITTLGSKGCLIYKKENDQAIEIPSFKVKAVDTVGAGDCFNGVLASKLFQGENLINAVKYATAAASIAVTRKGAQESMPYEEEIKLRYEELPK